MKVDWELINNLSSFFSFIITAVGLVLAIVTYKRDFAIKLNFKYTIGLSFNTATMKPVYGIVLNVHNIGNRPIMIFGVQLKICDKKLVLPPDKVKLKSGDLGTFNFAPSEGQVRYFISDNKKLLKKKLVFEVETSVKKYKIRCDMTCSDFFSDFFKNLPEIIGNEIS